MEFAKRVLAYLQGTLDTGIVVNRSGRADYLKLEMYSDSDWACDKETRKSTSGVMALVNDTLISWRTVGQKSVALSTMEAEYVTLLGSPGLHSVLHSLCSLDINSTLLLMLT